VIRQRISPPFRTETPFLRGQADYNDYANKASPAWADGERTWFKRIRAPLILTRRPDGARQRVRCSREMPSFCLGSPIYT
jgi:hypothetical protein